MNFFQDLTQKDEQTFQIAAVTKNKNFVPNSDPRLVNFSIEDQKFLNMFDFSDCCISNEEKVKLFHSLCQNKDIYSQYKYDVGCTNRKFHIKLQDKAELKRQRPSRVNLNLQDKLSVLLKQLQEAEIIREMGNENDRVLGTEFINPVILIQKGETLKLVIDARYLNSITDNSTYTWPLEPLQCLLDRIHGKYFSTIDMSCAYHQIPLGEETQNLVSFVLGGLQYTFKRGFYGLSGLPNFFSRVMMQSFRPMIENRSVLTYLDDLLAMADNKDEMFTLLDEFHILLRKSGMKAAPDKSFFFKKRVQYLGHMISEDGTAPIQKRVEALQKLKSPENKRDLMRIVGALNFYAKYIDGPVYVMMKPFFNLIKDETPWSWSAENESLLRKILDMLSGDTIRAIPNPKYPYFLHGDSSNTGTGNILIQELPGGKKVIIKYCSRVFTEDEQKLSTSSRELTGIVWALDIHEPLVMGSCHPLYVFTDHKPILYLWSKKGQLTHRFYKYQLTFTKFNNLIIVWTEGKNLAFPDLLSRNFTTSSIQAQQKKHKIVPKEIKFVDKNLQPISYFIEHEETIDDKDSSPHDSYPIICKSATKHYRMRLKGKETVVFQEDLSPKIDIDNILSINMIFNWPKSKENFVLCRNALLDETTNFQIQNVLEREFQLNEILSDSKTKNEQSTHKRLCTNPDSCYQEFLTGEEWSKIGCITNYAFEEDIETDFADLENQVMLAQSLTKEVLINNPKLARGELKNIFPEVLAMNTDSSQNVLEDMAIHNTLDITPEIILMEQEKDIVLKEVRKWVIDKKLPDKKYIRVHPVLRHFSRIFDAIHIHEETKILCYLEPDDEPNNNVTGRYKVIVPLSLIIPVFNNAHNGNLQGHHGMQKTMFAIQSVYYFPGLYKWVAVLLKDCLKCISQKPKLRNQSTAKLMSPSRQVTEPFHTIHIDFKGPIMPPSGGFSYIFVCVDTFSRMVYALPTKDATSDSALYGLQSMIYKFGIPHTIICDRGTHFMSRDFMQYCASIDISVKPLSGYNPWSNGQVETMNTHVARYIRQFIENFPTNWSKYVAQWAFAQNTSQISNFGMTPYEIVFGKKPIIPIQLRLGVLRDPDKLCVFDNSNLCIGLPEHSHFSTSVFNSAIQKFLTPQLTTETMRREQALVKTYSMVYFQSKMDEPDVHEKRNLFNLAIPLKIGQLVLQENKRLVQGISFKLQPLHKGIFKVTKIVTEVTYEIEELDTGQKVVRHRNLLLPYYPKILAVPHLITKFRLDNQITHRGWRISPSDHDPFYQFTPDANDNLPPDAAPNLIQDPIDSDSSDEALNEQPSEMVVGPISGKNDHSSTTKDSTGYGSMLGDPTGAIPKTIQTRQSDRLKNKKPTDKTETSGYETQSKIQTSPISDKDKTAVKTKITKIPKPQFTSTPKTPRYNLRSSKPNDRENDGNFDEISPVVEKVKKDNSKTKEPSTRTSQRQLQKKLAENADKDYQWFLHVYQKWDNMYDWSHPGQYYNNH